MQGVVVFKICRDGQHTITSVGVPPGVNFVSYSSKVNEMADWFFDAHQNADARQLAKWLRDRAYLVVDTPANLYDDPETLADVEDGVRRESVRFRSIPKEHHDAKIAELVNPVVEAMRPLLELSDKQVGRAMLARLLVSDFMHPIPEDALQAHVDWAVKVFDCLVHLNLVLEGRALIQLNDTGETVITPDEQEDIDFLEKRTPISTDDD